MLAAPAAASGDHIADLLVLQAVEGRVASIGYRLAASAGDLCGEQVPLAGVQIHDIAQYAQGDADDAAAAFGVGPWPKVLAVAQGSAAQRAGVKANDSIGAIDGRPAPPAGKPGYARVAQTLALLDGEIADGRVRLALQRDGKPLTIDVAADHGCASHFTLKIARGLQGKADGDYVEVTTGLVGFAPDDAELAAAIAHELAHNILRHRARLDAAGISRGLFQNFGKSARLTRETEVEADRLSVHLLDRAGYPMAASVTFWERFRKAIFDFGDQTHPGGKERVAVLKAEIARIQAAKARGKVPGFAR